MVPSLTQSTLVLALSFPAFAFGQECTRTSIGFDPLPITRTENQSFAAEQAGLRIVPRKPDGSPHLTKGRILFLWLGPSLAKETAQAVNAARFADPAYNPRVQMFKPGGEHNYGAAQWADPNSSAWIDTDLKLTGKYSPLQVQAIMIHAMNVHPTLDPEPNAEQWHQHVLSILDIAYARFPNLQVAFVMHGWYGAYDGRSTRSPEAWGFYEDARTQMVQDTYSGPIPFVGGMSIWTDGAQPRYDGLSLTCADLQSDGLHLNPTGNAKFGQHLWQVFKREPATRSWMMR